MDLKQLTKDEAIEQVMAMTELEDVRAAATSIGVTYSGNSKIASLKGKIIDFLSEDPQEDDEDAAGLSDIGNMLNEVLDAGGVEEPIQISVLKKRPVLLSDHDLINMDHVHEEDPGLRRRIVRAKALRMVRVRVQALDPGESQLNGVIITARNKYTGKISKYVPFASEVSVGYYVPKMILDHMAELKFPRRVEKKGAKFGIKQYNTIMSPKYTIEFLPHLSKKEIEDLAVAQRSSGAIDRAELSS